MKTIFFSLLIIFSLPLYAQQGKGILHGKITDSNGLPLPYVSVAISGSSAGTLTDESGNYILKVFAGNHKLTASLLGYEAAEKNIVVVTDKAVDAFFQLKALNMLLTDVQISGIKVKTVTATRTLMQIQDIPQSIAVIGQRVIKQQAAYDLSTITRNISGLNFTGSYSGAGSSQFFNARGFDLNDSQNYRWNGVMIWNLANNYSDNIEQVEFLKGPTSILFGDVAPGGVMNFVTKKPLADFMANAEFKTGSWGLIRPSVDISGPLKADRTLRFRLNTSFEQSNSFRDYVSSEREFIAPTIAWDITPKLSLSAEAVFKHSRSTDDAGLVSPDGTIAGLNKLNPALYLAEPERNYLSDDQSYSSTINYQLNKTWRLKAVGFYANTVNRPFGIWFDQPEENGDFVRRGYGYRQKSINGSGSFDISGSFYTGEVKHNILAGAEYQSTHYRYTNAGSLSILDTGNIYNPVRNQVETTQPATGPYFPYVTLISRRGIFFQDQLMFFNEKLHLLVGLRAGRTKQGNDYYEDELAGTDYEGFTDRIISKNVLTPRIGLVYKPKTWSSFYASWSKGYELNSPDIFARNFEQYASPPATISTQLEFGSKANLLGDKLGITVSVFEINKQNPYGYVYLNPENPNYDEYDVYYKGHHRSRGVELDVDGRLSSTLSLTAGAAYTKTKVTDDPGYPDGNVLPNAPKVTANFWLYYAPVKALSGFSAGAGFFYKDKFYSSIANNPDLKIPASYTLDASIGYSRKQIGVQLNVMNLTNRVSYLNPWQFNLFDVKPLRQAVLTLSYQFSKKN